MLGWLRLPHGYGFTDTPGFTIACGRPERTNQPMRLGAAAQHLEIPPSPVEAVITCRERRWTPASPR